MPDLQRVYSHIKSAEGKDLEPALFLVRKNPRTRTAGNNPCYCVPLSKAFLFDEDTDPLFAANEINKIIAIFDLGNPSKYELIQLWHLIQDGLDELINMPYDDLPQKTYGEGLLYGPDGKKISFDLNTNKRL